MTRLRDDQTGGEVRGVRIPVGIGAGFCGYPCGYICATFVDTSVDTFLDTSVDTSRRHGNNDETQRR